MAKAQEILVVDDEVFITEVLKQELSARGYHVQTAYDGEQALEIMKKVPLALIVLDLQMPRIDGFEVLRHVKEHYPAVKVIVLTGYADLGNAIRCRRLGADQFLEKPFNISEFLMEMERLISRSEAPPPAS